MHKLNVGLIGYGLSGKTIHAPLISASEDFELRKVYTSRSEELKARVPSAEAVQDLNEIFADPQIDLVAVCGPNEFHFEQVKLALECGKHVVVEKPFVPTLKQAEQLIELADKKEKMITVFQNRRWDCDYLAVKELLAKGALGEIKEFKSHFDRWRPENSQAKWRENPGVATGVFYDLAPHLIDQCLGLFGTPESIFADLEDQKNNSGVNNYFHVILKYKKMRAILHGTSFSMNTLRYSILGDKGNYSKHYMDPQCSMLESGVSPNSEGYGIEDAKNSGSLTKFLNGEFVSKTLASPKGDYISFYKKTANAIRANDPSLLPVSAKSALNLMKLIESCLLSSSERRWVDLA